MPFTPDSSVNSVTHVTLSHEGKEEDYRYTRRQVTRMPLHYTKCLEKRQSNVPVQIGAQQAQTVRWAFRKQACAHQGSSAYGPSETLKMFYTVHMKEKRVYDYVKVQQSQARQLCSKPTSSHLSTRVQSP